ncbi:MAG: tetratricopeptide repeat protein, partial [Chloroflexi bacterium]|nr:tetratricopeptide repeat protein [Chloroflexota bacterium]
ASVGKPHCHVCGKPISHQTVDQIVDLILAYPADTRVIIMAPVVRDRKGEFKKLFETDDSLSNEDHLKLAEMAYEDGDYSFVDQAAAPLLDIADSKGSALMILGKTRMVQGYYDEAVSFFRQAVEDNPYAPDRWVHLCDACRKDTEERDILGILNEGLSYLADSSTIHSEIAQEYYLNGKVTDALSYLQKAVSLPPDSKEGVINAGSLMVSMGDVQKAFEYYLNVLNRFEFDRDIARLAALSAMDNEEYETAEKILTTLFGQIKPTADDIASFILARLKGKSPIFSDDLDISTEELSKLNEKMDEGLKLDPEHLGINLLRAEMEAYLGDYESAQQIFRMLIEHDNTSHWKTLGGYGYTSLKLDDIPTAIAALQESYSINPEQTKLEQYLAEAYLEAGLLVDARSFADKLFSRKSNDPTTLLWYADLNGKMGDWEKVVAALQNAYHLNPGDPVIMMKLAESFVRTGRKQDANQLARLLINLPDLNADMLLGLANLFAQMGEWATVCDLLEKSLERGYPEPYQIHFAMSLMYQKMGDYETALNYSQKAMVSSDNYYLYIHQADLFYLLDKPQAALSCLDFSDTILPAADQSIFHHRLFNNLESIFHINNWLAAIHDGDGILFRRILSLRKLNKFEDAFRLAKDAYAAGKSENRIVILMDLAIRTANFGYVKTLVKENRHIDNKEIRQAIGLLNLRLNILLDNIDIVRKLVAEDQLARFSNSEWYCAQSIISRLDKKWDTANQNYRQAKTICLNKSALQASSNAVGMSGYDFISELLDDDPYWLWDTAAGLLIWDESIPELTRIAQEKPDHLAIQLELIKILTLAGEWTYLAAELEIEKRKPSLDRDAGEVRQLVQTSIKKFEKGIKEPNISKWVTRANIVYSKKQADIKEIGEQLQMPEDLEFLVGFLRKENKYTPAAEIAEKLGRHFKSIWQQALCYKHSNREKGIQLLKSDMDQSTGFPFQYIALGQLSEMSEDYPTAYQAYRQAVNIWKDEPLWHTHCADLAEKCGDGERSVLHLKKALNLGYKKLDTAMKLGKIYQNRSEFQKAIDTLEPVYQEGLGNFPLLMQLGFACYETGDTKKAFEYAEQAKTLDPASEQPFLLYARISDYMGQYHAAMEYTRKALELKPGDEDTLVLLSKYIEKSGNPDEAYQLLENVVVAGDAGWTVIGEYVRRKYERSGPSGVLSFLENLKNKGNLPEDMHAYLAEAYFEKEQLADAEHEALAAIKVDANSHKMNYLLAIINHRNGQLDLASHYAAQAIQLCPDRIDAYLELADIYKAKNETAKALEVYKQAINSNPGNHLGYFQAGLLLRETRDFQESEIMLKQAAKLVPDDINIHRQLGAVIALNLVHHAQEEKIVP